ncbi:PilW family protein [Simplicispira psychrophila]|uniref:PilW family protein n=1 Tax=Simplicispira psychrophila TaxID=80882 RepID=UPI000A06B6C4|nr:PilW family protein [Simplicispira psychrophila]
MKSKNIAGSASSARVSSQVWPIELPKHRHAQRGVTLIELMVGITIGLLTIAVAMGALMVSRGISGTISDASGIQQQAAYAMRVIGLQLRQAGSLRLNLDPGTATTAEPYLTPVAFEAAVSTDTHPALDSFDPAKATLSGTASPASLTLGYRRYTEPTFASATEQAFSRNCLGGPADTSTHQRLQSAFWLSSKNELRCAGNQNISAPPLDTEGQPILQNVANFQVRYLLQDTTTTPGTSTIKSTDAAGVTNWAQVQAVEVCLVLYGNESIGMPTDGTATYTDCDGVTKVDMATVTGERNKRLHVPFRNIFQLRSQGLVGSVL